MNASMQSVVRTWGFRRVYEKGDQGHAAHWVRVEVNVSVKAKPVDAPDVHAQAAHPLQGQGA